MDPKQSASTSSDKASVKSSTSFGSTVGLLKDRIGFSSSSSGSRKASDEKDKAEAQRAAKQSSQTLRNQINFVG